MKNPNCDNDKCLSATGEVRLLPTSERSNVILCFTCFQHEMKWRKECNAEIPNAFCLAQWTDLKIYKEAS